MIQEIRIENFKSVQKLKLPLGRFNVLIGENGCGKSNILEAIAMGAAAASDKLDNEFLANRGIRVTQPELMRSAFEKANLEKIIVLNFFISKDICLTLNLYNENHSFSNWQRHINQDFFNEYIKPLLNIYYDKLGKSENITELIDATSEMEKARLMFKPFAEQLIVNPDLIDTEQFKILKKSIEYAIRSFSQNFLLESIRSTGINEFLIFSPENSILRRFEDETQIEPLGKNGEGLFKLLTVISQEKPEQFEKIKTCLKEMFDWFEDFEIPKDLVFTEKRLSLKDRYLPDIQYISQRSANEGFLFVLFYVTLFVSDYTPSFFAIDNIDSALNPKLCRKLITVLTRLAREHDKQVILTTHNPAVLDGLDLNDEEQRLMVVWRNAVGHTKIKKVEPISTPEDKIPMRMSEAFMNGFIGGLPKNF